MTASAEETYEAEVRASLKRNYLSLLAHGVFGMTGFRLLNAPTFLPAYIFLLSESNLVVGLIVAAQHAGSALAALPGGNLISHRERVLPVFLTIGALMRAQILGIALAGLLLPDAWALKATALFLFLFGMFSGMQGVSFNVTVSKLVPVRVRGRLMGFRNFMAGFVSAAVALLGGSYFIENNTLGNGYATTFLMAFVLTAIGLVCLLWIREPKPPSVAPQEKLTSKLRGVPDLIRQSPGFARYIGAVSLATLSMAAVPFYILYAGEKTELTGREIGLLTVSFMLVQTLITPAWGYLADHAGNKLVFVGAIAVWAASLMLMLSADADWVLYVVFSGVGIGLGGFMIGSQNIMLEFGDRHSLPMLVAAASTATSLTAATGPILAGLFVSAFPYETLFLIAIGMKLTAVLITIFFIDEPRRRTV